MSSLRTDQVELDADGAMDLHLWTPEKPPHAAVLVIQEIFGVGEYIRAVAQRLADTGYLVGAPDIFWRFSPNWEADHSQAGLEASFEKVQQLDFPKAVGDCIAALEYLRNQPGIDAAPAVVGFCLGGTLAWSVAIHGDPGCCVSYYGSGVPAMIDQIDEVSCPTLFHFGNADPYIPNEGVDQVAAALAGHPGFLLNVENAGHAFDNHHSDVFYDEAAANSAWAKTMAFLSEHVPA